MKIDRTLKKVIHNVLTPFTNVSNKSTWESDDIVQSYNTEPHLQKPEETILNEIRSKLPTVRMIDIGVGTGRTTHFFAELTKEYIGIDYSSAMVRKCREIFREPSPKIAIEIGDVRNLSNYEDSYFDFALFSFNGLDYLDYTDRLIALHEIRRVVKKGGYFCFSTHNLNYGRQFFRFNYSKNIIRFMLEIYRYILIRVLNRNLPDEWEYLQFTILNDGTHGFRLKTFYIKPQEQIRQLADLGFTNTRVFGLADGKEIDYSTLDGVTDAWLYYLCNVEDPGNSEKIAL